MSEQLFKAYDNDKKEWVDDFYIDIYGNVFDFGIDDRLDIVLVSDPINATLVRATGLKDKHGQMIFDGDIVNEIYKGEYVLVDGGEKLISLVAEDKCNPCLCLERKNRSFCDVEYDFIKCEMLEIEVIGNKWDNPELLEEMK